MNKRGQTLYGIILTAIIIVVVGFLFINFIQPSVDDMMMKLSCGSADNPTMSLSDGQKTTCLIGETITPYFILAVLGSAGYLISQRVISGGGSG